uniref:hypothetical protein n=1 Tax=Amycolatopsis sp. CA-151526 TaxID=3239921 RepID=UPI003F490FDF
MSADAVNITEARQRVLSALTGLWREIQQQHPDVPDVLLAWASPSDGRVKSVVPQHLRTGPWTGALVITDERLGEVDELVEVLLHEACHALAAARRIDETSNYGRYHNKRFHALAEELGLEVTHVDRLGWSETSLPPGTATYRKSPAAAQLGAALAVYQTLDRAPAERTRQYVAAVCGCIGRAARPIRISESKLALGPITCGVCGQNYVQRPSRR